MCQTVGVVFRTLSFENIVGDPVTTSFSRESSLNSPGGHMTKPEPLNSAVRILISD